MQHPNCGLLATKRIELPASHRKPPVAGERQDRRASGAAVAPHAARTKPLIGLGPPASDQKQRGHAETRLRRPRIRYRQKPRRSGVPCIHDSSACGGMFNISVRPADPTVDAIHSVQGVAQFTASLFAAAMVFFGSVSSSTPLSYLASAVASSTS